MKSLRKEIGRGGGSEGKEKAKRRRGAEEGKDRRRRRIKRKELQGRRGAVREKGKVKSGKQSW